MRVFVTTCDKYLRYLKGFAYMFNKHWSSTTIVTVLGYSKPSFKLPNNFKFVSLGKQKKYGRAWATALIPFFKGLLDEYFILIVDDVYILRADKFLLGEVEKHMKSGIDKVFLVSLKATALQRSGIGEEKDANFAYVNQGYVGRLSLHPQAVKRDYFLKYLRSGDDIWRYENNNKKGPPKGPIHDGAQILVPRQDIAPYSNFVLKGKVNPKQVAKIKKEDRIVLKRLGVF